MIEDLNPELDHHDSGNQSSDLARSDDDLQPLIENEEKLSDFDEDDDVDMRIREDESDFILTKDKKVDIITN
jgi:hypothetical protein